MAWLYAFQHPTPILPDFYLALIAASTWQPRKPVFVVFIVKNGAIANVLELKTNIYVTIQMLFQNGTAETANKNCF